MLENGETSLHAAAREGDLESVKFILKKQTQRELARHPLVLCVLIGDLCSAE